MSFILLFSCSFFFKNSGDYPPYSFAASLIIPSFLSRKISCLKNTLSFSNKIVFLLPMGMSVISFNYMVGLVTTDSSHLWYVARSGTICTI